MWILKTVFSLPAFLEYNKDFNAWIAIIINTMFQDVSFFYSCGILGKPKIGRFLCFLSHTYKICIHVHILNLSKRNYGATQCGCLARVLGLYSTYWFWFFQCYSTTVLAQRSYNSCKVPGRWEQPAIMFWVVERRKHILLGIDRFPPSRVYSR